jgi:hypothetical protein
MLKSSIVQINIGANAVFIIGNMYYKVGGRSQTTLTRFWIFLTTYPPALTFSLVRILRMLTKSGHFWTTYLPRLANVVCERPLVLLTIKDMNVDGSGTRIRRNALIRPGLLGTSIGYP